MNRIKKRVSTGSHFYDAELDNMMQCLMSVLRICHCFKTKTALTWPRLRTYIVHFSDSDSDWHRCCFVFFQNSTILNFTTTVQYCRTASPVIVWHVFFCRVNASWWDPIHQDMCSTSIQLNRKLTYPPSMGSEWDEPKLGTVAQVLRCESHTHATWAHARIHH